MNIKEKIDSLLAEGFFNLRLDTVSINCKLQKIKPDLFKNFLDALITISKLSTTKFEQNRTCVRLISSFYAIQLSHSSDFIKYLFQTGSSYCFPIFVHSYLVSISTKVVSANKYVGNTNGHITPLHSFKETLTQIIEDDSLLIDLLKGTTFEKLLYPKLNSSGNYEYDLQPLRLEFHSYISQWIDLSSTWTKEDEYRLLCNILVDFPTSLYYSEKIETKNMVYTFCEQYSLGIYRYRNVQNITDQYYVQQYTLNGIGIPSLKQQAAFLSIFKPSFTPESQMINGDLIIDTSSLSLYEAWKVYFSMNIGKPISERSENSSLSSNTRITSKGKKEKYNYTQIQENGSIGSDLTESNVNRSFVILPNNKGICLTCNYSGFEIEIIDAYKHRQIYSSNYDLVLI